MKQDYFIYIYDKVKNKYIAFIVTNFIYLIFCIKFVLKKLLNKKKTILNDVEEARRIVSECWIPSNKQAVIVNQKINAKVDLTIIVPVYNRDMEVRNCIESLLKQKTLYNYEIIIVDDGSDETTKQLLYDYQNEQKVKLIFQENQGISGARNTGINHSVGKYLMFVDCDDYVHDDCVQILMEEAYKTSCDIVMGSYSLVKKKNNEEINRRNIVYSNFNVLNYKDQDFIMNYAGLPWGKVYRRELFNEIRFPVSYWYEDTIIHFLIFRVAKNFCYVPAVIYDYIWYEENFSKTQNKSRTQALERFWIVKKMIIENDRIGLPHDKILYKVILNHLGRYLCKAIENLPESIQEEVFVLSREVVIQNRPSELYHLNYYLKQVEEAFLTNNYSLWKLACKEL